MPGRQPFNFHLCTNSIETSDNPYAKINWQALVVFIFSFIIHVCVNLKIQYYKCSTSHSVPIISRKEFIKDLGITDIDNNSISGLVTNVLNVVLIFTSFLFSSYVNNMDPGKANTDSFYYIIYFYNLLYPCISLGTITFTYYVSHPPLRKTLYREIISNLASKISFES